MAAPRAARMPSMIYGTAWKKERTRELVKQAILTGFRGVDTAAQPKHYQEELVGQGVYDALREGGIDRDQIYIQTKFTSVHGQDPNSLPYDASKSVAEQVATSIARSLSYFQDSNGSNEARPRSSPYIDCLVLHSPYPSRAQTQEAWRAMERHVPFDVRTLGISNIYSEQELRHLYDFATVKPVIVQNRFYPATGYDTAIRAFCAANGIVYQSFWTLSANPKLLRSRVVQRLAAQVDVTSEVALYGLLLGLGNTTVLNGTTNAGRMSDDLAGIERISQFSKQNAAMWSATIDEFNGLLIAR